MLALKFHETPEADQVRIGNRGPRSQSAITVSAYRLERIPFTRRVCVEISNESQTRTRRRTSKVRAQERGALPPVTSTFDEASFREIHCAPAPCSAASGRSENSKHEGA